MFIFGWGPRETLINSDAFDCPVCKKTTQRKHVRQRSWMSFFFIPILPISSSRDFIRCQACQSIIPIDSYLGQSNQPVRLSRQALVGMLCGLFSLLTFCIARISIPNAICAIALGHVALRDIRKNHPNVDGRSLAIAALGLGYPALILSSAIGLSSLLRPRQFAGNDLVEDSIGAIADPQGNPETFRASDSPNESFKNAEYQIASKRDQPAGRGNSPEAIEMAKLFSERIRELSDEVFTKGRKPLLQLSDGEYLTFCELHPDRVLFLVHVPSYRKFTSDAKKTLAQLSWLVAQSTTAGHFKGEAKLGVGLRGVLTYGDILLGTAPASTEDSVTAFRTGDKEDLLEFFKAKIATDSTVRDMSKTVPGLPSYSLPSSDPFEPQPTPPLESPARGDLSVTTPPAPVVPAPIVPAPEAAAPGRSKPSRSKPKIDFANKISVELSGAIENTSWGTTSIALSPDAKWLAAGKMDDKLALFEVATGKPIGEPYPLLQAGQVTAVAFSAQGDQLVAGGYSGKTFAWQVSPDGSLLNEQEFFRFDSEIVTLATSPKFGFFIGASRKGTVAWQPFGLQKSQPRLMQQFQKEVCAVWLPSSGDEAMATDGARWIRFSLRDGEVSESDDLGIKSANLACFSRSGKRLVIADFNTLHLTDLAQRTSRKSIKLPRGDMAYALKFHPQENWVAVGMRGKVALFDFDRAELIAYADAESVFYQKNIAFSSDGRSLAATSDSARDTIKIFRIGHSKLESTTSEEPQP